MYKNDSFCDKCHTCIFDKDNIYCNDCYEQLEMEYEKLENKYMDLESKYDDLKFRMESLEK